MKNSQGFVPLILVVILAIAVIGGGTFYFLVSTKNTSTQEPISAPPENSVSPTDQTNASKPPEVSNTPPMTDTQLKDWKTYTNVQYGFELKYPPTYTVKQETSQNSDLLSLRIKDVSVRVTKKTGLKFSGVACESSMYDSTLNTWLSAENGCNQQNIYYNLVCSNTKIGQSALPAYQTGTGDAGVSVSVNYILTDKNYAVVLSRGNDQGSTEESMSNQDNILGSFRFLDGVSVKNSVCDINKIGSQVSLPSVSSPFNGSVVKISQGFNLSLSSNLPQAVGAAVFISQNAENVSYSLPYGDMTSGQSLYLKPLSEFLYVTTIPEFIGEKYLHLKFYKLVNGKKIFFGKSGERVVKLIINNDLVSVLELNINQAVVQNFAQKDGKIVLKKGSFIINDGILKITASNVKDCVRTVTSENNGAPAAMGAISNGTAGVYVPPEFPSSQLIVVTYSCKTPSGATITKALDFLSE